MAKHIIRVPPRLKGGDAPGDTAFDYLRSVGRAYRVLHNLGQVRAMAMDRGEVKYSIGQVFRHKTFGFRAVVYGWTHRPQVDVSRWDGVLGLPSGVEQPFYFMMPDQDDCIEFLGAPRGARYVAEENLEAIDEIADREIQHEHMSLYFDRFDHRSGSFVPTEKLQYQYPQDAGSATLCSVVVEQLNAIRLFVCKAVLKAEEPKQLEEHLFCLLKKARTKTDALEAERMLWLCWQTHADDDAHMRLDQVTTLMDSADYAQALERAGELVAAFPNFTEAWNKRATLHYLLGQDDEALEDCDKVLELERRHFGALSGRANILSRNERHEEALSSHGTALAVNPWIGGVVTRMHEIREMMSAVQEKGQGQEAAATLDEDVTTPDATLAVEAGKAPA